MAWLCGGHSHTVLEQPERVNGVLIAQAGVGTDQLGRFDLVVDDATNSIVDFQWRLVPVDSDTAEPDRDLQRYIDSFQEVVDRKYNTILCKLLEKLTHPSRLVETALGNFTADSFLNLSPEELQALAKPRVVATSVQDVLEEYFRNNQNATRKVEGRLVYR